LAVSSRRSRGFFQIESQLNAALDFRLAASLPLNK
jgi:hypothetical protein